jgi:hypothetical protein
VFVVLPWLGSAASQNRPNLALVPIAAGLMALFLLDLLFRAS